MKDIATSAITEALTKIPPVMSAVLRSITEGQIETHRGKNGRKRKH